MKYRTAIALLICPLGFAYAARAQAPWFQFSSPDEYFRVLMPHHPKEDSVGTLKTNYGELEIKVKSYQASADGANYSVWVLTHTDDSGVRRGDKDAYLDACAELVWEGLLKPQRDQLRDDRRATAAMTYVKELPAKPLPGREYTLTVGKMTGTTQFFVAESRVYVLLGLNSFGASQQEPFFQSFMVAAYVPGQLSSATPEVGAAVASPNDLTDNEKIFRSSEVTSRARVLAKAEPSYTESARKFSITGTVVLRAVFSRNGEVTNLRIIRKLPHGLTQRAVDAARGIRFIPAVKDGQPVSMWMQLEYNFNLY